ncbi:hypothetical protein [Pseudomonas sp. NPDC008258]|uniref:hypothetical protein n=1 Tax=Pseudomonas sp. NPDC008258 TaxID=3364418 RepID=UPI0036EAE0FA
MQDLQFPQGLFSYEEFLGCVCWDGDYMFWSIIKPGNGLKGNEVTTAWGQCHRDHAQQQLTVVVEGSNDLSLIGQSLIFGFEWLDETQQCTRYWQILPNGLIGRQGTAIKR